MKIVKSFIADLHIHSRYSRATSKASTLHGLAAWAAIKGITVVGTGDFTHPGWFAHLGEHLEPAEPGFYRLRTPPDFKQLTAILPPGVEPDTSSIRFVLTAEISSIYKRGGKVRKVHNILFAPDFSSVRRINTTLAGIGNLESDGRPILGLDSQLLLEILLEHAQDGFLVPAHIWTPWFSLFGSKSGFDAIEECFGDLAKHIFALETGLSSDPEMNRSVSALDRFTLISNSDCHSPAKLGREANIFRTHFDFYSMREAIRNPADEDGEQRFTATIEFYPEEGKYHCDGHRKCGVCLEPVQTIENKGDCPVCGRPVTIGVLYRVNQLADRSSPVYPAGSPAVHSLVPLPELLAELFNCGSATKKVAEVYGKLINTFGSEFEVLLNTPVSDLASVSPMLGESVQRVRVNRVIRKPGFDGEFGVIRVFDDRERAGFGGQLDLFGVKPAPSRKKKKAVSLRIPVDKQKKTVQQIVSLNSEQRQSVESSCQRILVTAGPGTGKTFTLVERVLHLQNMSDRPVTVITFTNKAVAEVQERIQARGKKGALVNVKTFHGFCLQLLRQKQPDINLVGPEMRKRILSLSYPGASRKKRTDLQRKIGLFLASQSALTSIIPEELSPFFDLVRKQHLLDLDEVIPACVALLDLDESFTRQVQQQTGHLLIDEFQDLNAGQYALVKMLSVGCSLFVIGDPDQAIYGFRGSNPKWFQKFIDEMCPETFILKKNYRSGRNIIAAAAQVIEKNRVSTLVPVAAGQSQGSIFLCQTADPAQEAKMVAARIQQLLGGTSHREIDRIDPHADLKGLALSDIAVLYRTGRQAKVIADTLADRSIPCQVLDVFPFYQQGEARLLFYWVLLAAGLADKAEFLYLCRQQKGIGNHAVGLLDNVLPEQGGSWLSQLTDQVESFSDKLRTLIQFFNATVKSITQSAAKDSVSPAVDFLIEEFDIDISDPNVIRFSLLAESMDNLLSFADHLRKYQNSIVYDDRAESVLLSTLHASKGLEFKAVFIVGCEEGLLPLSPRIPLDETAAVYHEQEERRLFFVGMTRAQTQLFLSNARKRAGDKGMEKRKTSRFIRDISPDLLVDTANLGKNIKKKVKARQLRLF